MGMSSGGGGGGDGGARQNPLYAELVSAWQSEEACPELLDWKESTVRSLTDSLEAQEQNVEAAMEQAGVVENLFSAPLYQAECARLRYVLSAYARSRLRKIVTCGAYLQEEKMSYDEKKFCRRYLKLCSRHHRVAFLNDLPGEDEEDVILKEEISRPPPSDNFVFARVLEDLGEVVIDEDTSTNTAYLSKDDVHILQYSAVKPLVDSGQLQLF